MDKETLTEDDVASLQDVDRIYTEMQLSSEAAIYQSKTKHEFSDTLHNQKCIRQYWRRILRLSKFSNTHESLALLNPAHEEANFRMRQEEIFCELREIGAKISGTLAGQDTARIDHLKQRVCLEPMNYESGAYKAVGNIDAMMKQERLREDWTKIKATTKDRRTTSAPSLEIPETTDDVAEMWDLLKTKRTPAKDLK